MTSLRYEYLRDSVWAVHNSRRCVGRLSLETGKPQVAATAGRPLKAAEREAILAFAQYRIHRSRSEEAVGTLERLFALEDPRTEATV